VQQGPTGSCCKVEVGNTRQGMARVGAVQAPCFCHLLVPLPGATELPLHMDHKTGKGTA
jgi:hypothetical protein